MRHLQPHCILFAIRLHFICNDPHFIAAFLLPFVHFHGLPFSVSPFLLPSISVAAYEAARVHVSICKHLGNTSTSKLIVAYFYCIFTKAIFWLDDFRVPLSARNANSPQKCGFRNFSFQNANIAVGGNDSSMSSGRG